MFIRFVVTMSLTLILTSSSFFFPGYIESRIKSGEITQSELSLALNRSVSAAIYYAHENANKGSNAWLNFSLKLAKFDDAIALQLANYFSEQQNNTQALYWWQYAAKLGNHLASISLMNHYLSSGQLEQAVESIENTTKNEQLFLYRIELSLIQGDVTKAISLTRDLQQDKYVVKLKHIFKRYKIDDKWPMDYKGIANRKISTSYQMVNLANQIDFPLLSDYSTQCVNSVQVFATNLSDLFYAEKLIQQVQKSSIGANFCFAPVRYIPLHQLACQHKQGHVAQCDQLALSELTDINTRYISILLPNGGAKVDHGIMYLDRNDTPEVFEHELAHWLGFIDEYPLPANHQRCHQKQAKPFSHNIAVLSEKQSNLTRKQLLQQIPWSSFIKDTTPLKTKTDAGWKLGTPVKYKNDIGLYPAETCNNNALLAFKPLSHRTKLQYFELTFPKYYAELIKSGEHNFSMPSYHYNFALLARLQGQDKLANYWFKKAASMENSPLRQQTIKRGEF